MLLYSKLGLCGDVSDVMRCSMLAGHLLFLIASPENDVVSYRDTECEYDVRVQSAGNEYLV